MMLPGGKILFEDSGGGVDFVTAIESDGVACVVVPHVHTNVNDAEVRLVVYRPSDTSVLRGKNLFGYSKNDSMWVLNNYNDGSSAEFQIYSVRYAGRFLWDELTTGFHEIVASCHNGTVVVTVDGVEKINSYQSGVRVQGRFGLFTQNDIDGDAVNPIPGRAPKGVPVQAFDAWDGGVLATSLRPCIDKSGVPCFFDLVSQSYIYSATGGAFIVSE